MVPSFESEMRRVRKECEDAEAKARLLMDNVTLAAVDDVEADSDTGDGIIQVRKSVMLSLDYHLTISVGILY